MYISQVMKSWRHHLSKSEPPVFQGAHEFHAVGEWEDIAPSKWELVGFGMRLN